LYQSHHDDDRLDYVQQPRNAYHSRGAPVKLTRLGDLTDQLFLDEQSKNDPPVTDEKKSAIDEKKSVIRYNSLTPLLTGSIFGVPKHENPLIPVDVLVSHTSKVHFNVVPWNEPDDAYHWFLVTRNIYMWGPIITSAPVQVRTKVLQYVVG
jgi:hypothetical protein